MNRLFLTGLTLCLFLSSCRQKEETTYKVYSSTNGIYSVEVPSFVVKNKCIADFMSFENDKYDLIISIQKVDGESIEKFAREKCAANDSFTYTCFQSSDSTSFYKITRGNNMWSAYDLYMLRKLHDDNYIIQVSSDIIDKTELVGIINHIYSSIKLLGEKTDKKVTTPSDTTSTNLSSEYSNKYYSIKYPLGWKTIKNLNDITDVYIGSEKANFGFTIVRFETDLKLSDINKDGNNCIRQAGFKINAEKLISLCGQSCYKAIHTYNIQNQKAKHVSYTFKKGNMLYNIKFGNVTSKKQESLITEIMKSFYLK